MPRRYKNLKNFSADESGAGELVLQRPWQRFAFTIGLIGFVLLTIFASLQLR